MNTLPRAGCLALVCKESEYVIYIFRRLKMMESESIKVVLRNSAGRYIAGNALNWGFVKDHRKAMVFDYVAHRVEEQLAFLRKWYGIVLEAEPLPANEVYETCDCCDRRMMPVKAFFDGKNFLCHDCRAKTAPGV